VAKIDRVAQDNELVKLQKGQVDQTMAKEDLPGIDQEVSEMTIDHQY